MFHKIRLTPQKIAQRLKLIEPLVYRQSVLLPAFRYRGLDSPSLPAPVGIREDDSTWEIIDYGSYWGQWLGNFILRSHFEIPSGFDPHSPVALFLPLGESGDFSHPEAMAYIDGEAYASCDRHHQELILSDAQRTGEHTLALHGWAGLFEGDPLKKLLMKPCQIVQIDLPTREFTTLARVALGIVQNLDEGSIQRAHLLNALDAAFIALDTREPFTNGFYESVAPATKILQAGVDAAGQAMDVDITAVGHAHIDVAWLWTLEMTRRKAARTFYNVIRHMDRYRGYEFTQSQPALYEYVRQDEPQLFEQIKQRIAEGRWEPIGGMWVEADCNLTGSESLARQFLLGVGFYKEHFGEHAATPVLWLPDVFGYNWNLPQLITEAGLKYFFTIKIGWSEYNRLPFDSFWWQGLDGTRVLTHFSTTNDGGPFASTYNAEASPRQTLNTWYNYQQKDSGPAGVTPPLLMSYGYGDGGGGPTREMIENIQILQDFPGSPHLRFGKAKDFYEKLEKEVGDRLPVWNGELYLEYHRGTYTTQARNKRANRKVEFLLHDTEFLAAAAVQMGKSAMAGGYDYPQADLYDLWRTVCTNQFHDILPGSSIAPVYFESQAAYASVSQKALELRQKALEVLASRLGGSLLVVNPTSFTRTDLALWANAPQGLSIVHPDGRKVMTQAVEDGLLLDIGPLEPYSITPLRMENEVSNGSEPNRSGVEIAPDRLENDYLRVLFNQAGDIVSLFDKVSQREILPAGAVSNQFQAFEDRPLDFDAWDINIYYDDKMWLAEPAESIRIVDNGPLRATLEISRRILHSRCTQRISLDANSPRLDFQTKIDWQEKHILLKAAFPVDVLSPRATYEIQWGNVERPTHRNTSWDWGRFESVGHKWVDLSEGNYGVSLLNDCKYGHDIRDQVIRLSLLRSPSFPDPNADEGEHVFAYSLLPHAGAWDESTISAAYALNDAIIVYPTTPQPFAGGPSVLSQRSFLAVDSPNIIIETIKGAEDGRGMIVRLYESRRQRGEFTLAANFNIAEAYDDSLIEQDRTSLQPKGNTLTLPYRPFQIQTIRLIPE